MVKKPSYVYFLTALAAVAYVFVTSCATTYGRSGAYFSSDKTYLVVKGMTGEEVLQIMESAPYERLVLDGRETWIWVFSDQGKTKSFSVSLLNEKVTDTFTYAE